MKSLSKYKQNLKVTEDNVYSYNTKVAKIDHTNREIVKLPWNVGGRTTSPTTSKHINYVAEVYGYQVTTFISENTRLIEFSN